MEQRLAEYQADFPIKLTSEESAALASACSGAQTVLRRIADRLSTVVESRDKAYATADARLTAVQKRLSNQSLDTSVIDAALIGYRKDVNSYNDALGLYRQALDDAVRMDCGANPAAFRSSLEAIRSYRKRTADAANTIKSFVEQDLSTAFATLTERLKEVK